MDAGLRRPSPARMLESAGILPCPTAPPRRILSRPLVEIRAPWIRPPSSPTRKMRLDPARHYCRNPRAVVITSGACTLWSLPPSRCFDRTRSRPPRPRSLGVARRSHSRRALAARIAADSDAAALEQLVDRLLTQAFVRRGPGCFHRSRHPPAGVRLRRPGGRHPHPLRSGRATGRARWRRIAHSLPSGATRIPSSNPSRAGARPDRGAGAVSAARQGGGVFARRRAASGTRLTYSTRSGRMSRPEGRLSRFSKR